GGNLAKAVGELSGCVQATGADVKAFCCGPVHALVIAAGLVASGLFREVAVVGGCSLAKLGMKFLGHLKHDQPVLDIVTFHPRGFDALVEHNAIGRLRISKDAAAAVGVTEP
ncbi:MAG: glycine reductase, partial [Chloroflexota bacterium]|nr:glycine reductase [Chloroflexota bacterium]